MLWEHYAHERKVTLFEWAHIKLEAGELPLNRDVRRKMPSLNALIEQLATAA
jgi:hypothetical protein